MADVFPARLKEQVRAPQAGAGWQPRRRARRAEVHRLRRLPEGDRLLKPGDVAIFATPLAFRWVHFDYAIEKGINVFMEKPLPADGPSSPRMLKLAEEAKTKTSRSPSA